MNYNENCQPLLFNSDLFCHLTPIDMNMQGSTLSYDVSEALPSRLQIYYTPLLAAVTPG